MTDNQLKKATKYIRKYLETAPEEHITDLIEQVDDINEIPNIMKTIIAVHTGEIKASKKDIIFKSSAIGTCIAIAAYDAKEKVGALAHTMLPGKAPAGEKYQKKKYAADAIEEIISRMNLMGAKKENIEVCIAGGANILKRKDDTIGLYNLTSVIEILKEKK